LLQGTTLACDAAAQQHRVRTTALSLFAVNTLFKSPFLK
jgi:hypothetical protein